MPVRDNAAMIGEQLAALARQDLGGPWELVVVDDASADDSMAIAQR
jgi:glycosyltransferase involved in cell wall biosynthesis